MNTIHLNGILSDTFPIFPGAVGDWINYFTSKQKRVFDELFTEKMKHSELARHFEDYS